MIWQNGEPVSYQLRTNQILKGNHYSNISQYKVLFIENCFQQENIKLLLFNCYLQQHNIPDDYKKLIKMKNHLPTKLVKLCTLLLLHNLAEPEWISVRCDTPFAGDILCMVNTEIPENVRIKTEASTEIFDKYCILVTGKCYRFVWPPKSEAIRLKYKKEIDIKILQFVLDAISENYPSIFSPSFKYIMKYNFNVYKFTKEVREGAYILSEKPKNFTKQGNLIQCASGSFISILYFCNGIFDCPVDNNIDEMECQINISKKYESETIQNIKFHAQNTQTNTDQVVIKVNLLHNDIKSTCPHMGQLKCSNACYYSYDICLYRLNQFHMLIPCSAGEHMQSCEKFECNMKFKCPGFYCIPWNYVCDGKWDCPQGYDELVLHNCGVHRKCKNMFKCVDSQICIHVGDICDGYKDCPYGDDELLCSLHHVTCPAGCKCLIFTVECYNVLFQTISFPFLFPYIVISLKYCDSVFTIKLLSKLVHSRFLFLTHNDLVDMCNIQLSLSYTLIIDLGFNKLKMIDKGCFYNGFKIMIIKLNNNLIQSFSSAVVVTLHNLQYLDLSYNNIKTLYNDIFLTTTPEKVLAISKISVSHISEDIFKGLKLKVLLTDDYHMCCLLSAKALCTAHIPWYDSCSGMLTNIYIRWCFYSISSLVIFLNIMTFTIQRITFNKEENNSGAFQTTSDANSLLCIIYGSYILTMSLIDLKYGTVFTLFENQWRSGITCFFEFAVVLNFNVFSPLITTFLCLSRLMVVVHPLTTKFKNKNFVLKNLIWLLLFSVTMASATSIAIFKIYSSIPYVLCHPFIDPSGSVLLVKITTWIVVTLQTVLCVVNVILSLKLLKETKISQKAVQKSVKKSNRAIFMTIQIMILMASNVLTWIPSGVIYLALLNLNKYPIEIVAWTIILITTINPVINPLVFIATTVKKLLT